jgi:hypothetical protein
MIEKTKEINSNEVIKVISLEDVSKILEEQLILSGLSNSVVCSHESYAYTLNNDSKICDDCDAIFE